MQVQSWLLSSNNTIILNITYPVMVNEIRTGDHRGFNKGRSSKFRVGSRVRHAPEEGRRTYRPKRRGNNNKDDDNSSKTLNDKNHQASSQKFRQLISRKWLQKINYTNRIWDEISIFSKKKKTTTKNQLIYLIHTHTHTHIYIYIYIYIYILALFTELHLKANAIISNSKDVLTQ